MCGTAVHVIHIFTMYAIMRHQIQAMFVMLVHDIISWNSCSDLQRYCVQLEHIGLDSLPRVAECLCDRIGSSGGHIIKRFFEFQIRDVHRQSSPSRFDLNVITRRLFIFIAVAFLLKVVRHSLWHCEVLYLSSYTELAFKRNRGTFRE